MAALDSSIGFLLVCTWVNAMLLSLELNQLWRFFANFPKERPWIKVLVGFAFLWDLVGSIACCAIVYIWGVTNWGVPAALTVQPWPVPMYAIAIGVNAGIVQGFLIWRLWALSKQGLFVILFGAWALAASVGAFLAAGTIERYPSLADRDKVKIPALIFVVLAPSLDIALSTVLVFYFRQAKTGFSKTDSWLKRLIVQAIASGWITCLFAIPALITYLWNQESIYPTGITMCMGRVYTLTMLFNLNHRLAFRGASANMHSSAQSKSDGQDVRMGPVHSIRVERTVVHDGASDEVGDIKGMPYFPEPDSEQAFREGRSAGKP